MSTPSDFQRLASVVRTTFPAPVAGPFYASTEERGAEALPGLLAAVLRYLTLIYLRAYWSGSAEVSAVEERLAVLSGPAPDGRWLELLRELVRALEPHTGLQPDPVLLELLAREKGLEFLADAVSLRNRLVHEGDAEAEPALRRTLHQLLGLLLPLRFHRVVVPSQVTSTTPINAYRALLYQGYTRPYPTTRLKTDLSLSLDTVYLARAESPLLLNLSPLILADGEKLFLLSHRSGKDIVYWDPISGTTAEKTEPRLELDGLAKRLRKGTGIVDARQLQIEGEALVSRRLSAGTEVGERYEVVEYLRSGGMADVYAARDKKSGEAVALKMLPLELTRETATLARFLREVDEVRKVDHPRVVRYHDHGEDVGDRYLVLERATGWKGRGRNGETAIDLGDLEKPLSEDEIVLLARDVAEGLQAIHARGLVHRDLKPGNVLLFEDEKDNRSAKISDFGISVRAGMTQYTLTGFFVGTPEYMAPEQSESGADVGPATDIYALGVILYECLTGAAPFRGATPFATLEQHRARRPEWPLRRNPKISRGLANVAMKCLQKEAKKRYRSGVELLEDLKRHREDPAGFQEISTLRAGEDLGDLILEEEIEADPEGTVFRAKQPSTGKTLRVRAFSSTIADDAEKRERVLSRVKRLAEAHHPTFPLIVGTGEARGTPYVVVEPAAGEVPKERSARAALDVAHGLEALHARGLAHGRVEREFLRVDGARVSFTDFGWLVEEKPAQDILALGAFLEGAGPSPPSPASKSIAIHGKALTEQRPPNRSKTRTTDLDLISSKARRATDGYRGIGELIEDLECFLASRPLTHARPSTMGYVLRLFLARHRLGVVAAAAALMLASIGGVLLWTYWPGPRYLLTNVRRLTSDPGLTTEPSLSRNGKLIAYASDRAGKGNFDIWIQPVEGGEPRQLTTHDADDREPDLSRDGKLIAFRSERDGGGVYLVNVDGSGERKLVENGRTPRISPDGSLVAYWVGTSGGDPTGARVCVIPTVEGQPRVLCPDLQWALEPCWSPDGQQLLVFGGGAGREGSSHAMSVVDWWVVPLEGASRVRTEIVVMFPERLREFPGDYRRSGIWASEGNQYCFSVNGEMQQKLWTVTLSSTTFRATAPPQVLSGAIGLAMQPSMAEGGRLAFSSTVWNSEIWSLPIDARNAVVLGDAYRLTENPASETHPSTSLDGSHLVFRTDRSGRDEIWIKQVQTGQESPLLAVESVGKEAIISSDGARVAYVVSYEGPLRIVSLGSGKVEREFAGAGQPYHWSSDGSAILMWCSGLSVAVLDTDTGDQVPVLRHPEYELWQAHLSRDDRWVAFNAVRSGRSRLFAAKFRHNLLIPPEEWIAITDETSWDDKPTWSPDGNFLYFISERGDGFRCIWAQRLESETKKPSGDPFVIKHFHNSRLSLKNVDWGSQDMSLARDRLVFCLGEVTGNIWMGQLSQER